MQSSLPPVTAADFARALARVLGLACRPQALGLGLGLVAGLAPACGGGEDRSPAMDAAPDAQAPEPDAGGGDDAGTQPDTGVVGFQLVVPKGFPPPVIPADNPLTEAKVELGRHLFYDKRLSGNETQSCASCHKQELAFTDGRAQGLGSTGELHPRGSMSLANVVYASTLTWANKAMTALEKQAEVPMFGDAPVELGLKGMEEMLLARLKAEPKYQELFPAAFPDAADPFSVENVTKAIASFERTLISGNSPFDRYERGETEAISESARRGSELFETEKFDCFHCHGGFSKSDQINHANQPSGEDPFHNTGLYNLDLEGSYPPGNQGLFDMTKNKRDKGRFKAPTLRNIAVTAPYMHDGSVATLEAVLDHYGAGGRTLSEGPYAGSKGFDNPNKSEFVHGFNATPQEREDLLAFLRSLTDEEFLTNPKYADPWPPAR